MRLIDADALKHKRVIATYGNLEQGLEEREVVYVEDIDNAPTIEAKEVASNTNVGSKGVKIPVISMEDVPKLMEEMEK